MSMFRYAILTVAFCLGTVSGAGHGVDASLTPTFPDTASIAVPPPANAPEKNPDAFEPIQVRFRLADGVRVTGELTGWDDDGIDGSFARRAWTEIHYDDTWKLYRRLMDRSAPLAWVDLGRTLLIVALDQTDARALADRAFREAGKLAPNDPVVTTAIENARIEADDERRLRDRIRTAAEAQRLHTESPEARTWTPRPWPKLDTDEQQAAVQSMRADATDILERAGLTLEPVETKFFLFYSDMNRREAQKWARQLDEMYDRLAARFELPKTENIFWGKAVIFVFKSRDRFRLVEAEAFGQLAADWADGLCHPVGPKVFVNFYRQRPDEVFAAILVHETVHGFMHRYKTPYRLPTWANEGFADYLASVLFRNSPIDLERRRQGVRFVRRGGDVNAVLDWRYGDDSWPGPGRVGYNVGYLMVELMIRDRPRAFGAWVDAIKEGKDWEQALEEDFGVTRAQLVETFVRFYRVND